MPIGFWSQLWKGAESQYSFIEKQLTATYVALQAYKVIMAQSKVLIKIAYPIAGWLRSWVTMPKLGVVQTPTLAKWGAYLEQREALSTSPLSQQLQTLLGSVTYETLSREEALMKEKLFPCPFHEGEPPFPETMWYMGGSCRGNLLHGWQWLSIWIQTNGSLTLKFVKVANGLN